MVEKLEHYIQSLNEEKERQKIFTDNITHELKTPITAILGHADLLQRLTNEEDKSFTKLRRFRRKPITKTCGRTP